MSILAAIALYVSGLASGYLAGMPREYEVVEQEHFMKVTAYCPCEKCCGRWADGHTASGYEIQDGDRFVSAPKPIPFGTKFIIPGYNQNRPVEVRDRGGEFVAHRLDVYFDTHEEAKEWGVKILKVKVVNGEFPE